MVRNNSHSTNQISLIPDILSTKCGDLIHSSVLIIRPNLLKHFRGFSEHLFRVEFTTPAVHVKSRLRAPNYHVPVNGVVKLNLKERESLISGFSIATSGDSLQKTYKAVSRRHLLNFRLKVARI